MNILKTLFVAGLLGVASLASAKTIEMDVNGLVCAFCAQGIEKTLKHLGSDGDAIRGVLERDFADYVKKAAKSRNQLRTVLALSVARPLLSSGAKAAAGWLFSSGEQEGFDERLAKIRERLEGMTSGKTDGPDAPAAPATPKTGSLRDDAEDVSGV